MMTSDQVDKTIRLLETTRNSQRSIAKKVGISQWTVSHIKRRYKISRFGEQKQLNSLEQKGLLSILKKGKLTDREIMDAFDVGEQTIDEYRNKLSLIEQDASGKKLRICLKHGGMFLSDGPGNRICRSCRVSQRSNPTLVQLHAIIW